MSALEAFLTVCLIHEHPGVEEVGDEQSIHPIHETQPIIQRRARFFPRNRNAFAVVKVPLVSDLLTGSDAPSSNVPFKLISPFAIQKKNLALNPQNSNHDSVFVFDSDPSSTNLLHER